MQVILVRKLTAEGCDEKKARRERRVQTKGKYLALYVRVRLQVSCIGGPKTDIWLA